MTHKRDQFGFTLIELLVAIAIIGILIAILLPAFQSAKSMAVRSDCVSRLKQVVTASHTYSGDWDGAFPYRASCDLPHQVANQGVKLNEILFDEYFLSMRDTAFCPGDLFDIRNPDTTHYDYGTWYITYQYFNYTTSKGPWKVPQPNLTTVDVTRTYPLWSCLTIYRQPSQPQDQSNFFGHHHADTPGPLQGMNAAWTDGSARWTPGDRCEVFIELRSDGGDYMWPDPDEG